MQEIEKMAKIPVVADSNLVVPHVFPADSWDYLRVCSVKSDSNDTGASGNSAQSIANLFHGRRTLGEERAHTCPGGDAQCSVRVRRRHYGLQSIFADAVATDRRTDLGDGRDGSHLIDEADQGRSSESRRGLAV